MRRTAASVASMRVPSGSQTSMTNWSRSASGKNCWRTRDRIPMPATKVSTAAINTFFRCCIAQAMIRL